MGEQFVVLVPLANYSTMDMSSTMDIDSSNVVPSGSRLKRVRSLDDINYGSDEVNFDVNSQWVTQAARKRVKCKLKSPLKPLKKQSAHSIKNENCMACKQSCVTSASLHCDFCDDWFHPKCTDLDTASIHKNITLINALGWMCPPCKCDIRKLLGNFRSETSRDGATGVTTLIPETAISLADNPSTRHPNMDPKPNSTVLLSGEKNSVGMMGEPTIFSSAGGLGFGVGHTSRVTGGGGDVRPSGETAGHPPVGSLGYAEAVKLVKKTVNEVSRRKRNVVVSGFPETENGLDNDVSGFIDICENNLHIKLGDKVLSAKRLGKSESNSVKCRRLLITLDSESSASDLLARARTLRMSHDPSVARNIFINADLSPDEEKSAFDRRVARRNAALASNVASAVANNSTSTTAPSTAVTSHNERIFYRSLPSENLISLNSGSDAARSSTLLDCGISSPSVHVSTNVVTSCLPLQATPVGSQFFQTNLNGILVGQPILSLIPPVPSVGNVTLQGRPTK